jgi:2-dehydropantoate 2-reductase
MRFIIYGAGAIGGTIGARLFQHGHDVLLIARGAHLQAIQARGLRFATPAEEVSLPIPAVGHPAEIDFRQDDVVVLCMKSQHTMGALDDLYNAAGDEVPVICGQNGVANERMALRRFLNVYAMVIMLPASHLEPGLVIAESKKTTGILDAGCYPTGTDATIEAVTYALDASQFSAVADPVVMRQKYAKLLMNLNNGLQAACGEKDTRDIARIARIAREEARTCYQAAGIDAASDQEFIDRRGSHIQVAPVKGHERGGSSTWQSVTRGTGDIEVDYLNGEIALLGRLHGVPTPVNIAIQEAANRLVRERLAPGSIPAASLQARIADLIASNPPTR